MVKGLIYIIVSKGGEASIVSRVSGEDNIAYLLVIIIILRLG
jgi:hypothetical protein